MVTLTVGLPVFNSKQIVWLAMESLCRQRDITFEWELIIAEEREGAAGEEFYLSYYQRLQQIGCSLLKYIQLDKWTPLGAKWRTIGLASSKSSIVFVQQSADDYWHDKRLADCYFILHKREYDWYMMPRVYMYHIFSMNVIYYDHALKGIGARRLAAVGHAFLTIHIRRLPVTDKRKGIDNWILTTINHPRIFIDTRSTWKKCCGTQGLNSISKKRGKYFENVRPPFLRTNEVIEGILPLEITARLKQLREEILGMRRETIKVEELNTIADVKESEPVSFVWVWVSSQAKWKELAYSIRSVSRFYKGEARYYVVGDNPNMKGVAHIPAQRICGFAYCRSMDITNKLSIIINTPEITENFVYMYDDIIFLKQVTLDQLKLAVAHDLVEDYAAYFTPGKGVLPSPKWRTLFSLTIQRLIKYSLPTYNYETHLPRVLNKGRLKFIIEKHHLDRDPYLFNSLYFNTYHSTPDVELRSNFNIKAGVYRPYDNPKSLESELRNKLYLNYNDVGLNDLLKITIQRLLA